MKKNLLLTVTILSFGFIANAQFYVKAGVGYNIALTKTFYQDQTINAANGLPTLSEFNGVNLAKGVAPAIGIGYMFNKHVGFELGAVYTLGSDNVVNTTVMSGSNTAQKVKQIIHSKSLVLYPSLKLQTGVGLDGVQLYTRSSLVIPVAGYTSNKFEKNVLLPSASVTNIEAKIHGNPTLGLGAALGIDIALTDKLSLWGEINGQSLKVWAKKSKITQYDVNGTSALGAMTVYQKETNFVKTLNSTSNNASYNASPNTAKPMDDMRSREANFDAAGIALGLKICF